MEARENIQVVKNINEDINREEKIDKLAIEAESLFGMVEERCGRDSLLGTVMLNY